MDGVDECVRYDEHGNPRDLNAVKEVLRDVLQLAAPVSTSLSPKVLLVSRDILQISGFLTKKPTLSLDHEADAVRKAIRTFTHQRLQEIQHNFQGFQAVDTILHRLEDEIVQKSRGNHSSIHCAICYIAFFRHQIDHTAPIWLVYIYLNTHSLAMTD
jgi:hypothetical protein